MTPFSEMTNEELDRYIAELRGWEYSARGFEVHIGSGLKFPYKNKITGKFDVRYPSPTTDPHYAMELLEEMMESDILIRLGNGDGDSRDLTILYLNSKQPNLYILTNDTKRTISEAYAQWKPKNK